jgi:hypothetical protein
LVQVLVLLVALGWLRERQPPKRSESQVLPSEFLLVRGLGMIL